MSDNYYKVLRSDTLEELEAQVFKARSTGWEPVGKIDFFNGEFTQAIKLVGYEDDTTEIITIRNEELDG